jgi:hypothetical protein
MNPIEGKYYDWPVGFHVGLDLQNFWQLEEHKLGEQSSLILQTVLRTRIGWRETRSAVTPSGS